MKAIMISIKPKWCAKIMNGEKTIEVRKNKALASAIQKLIDEYGYADIYVYCSKNESLHYVSFKGWCNGNTWKKERPLASCSEDYSGKVAFKFRCYKVEEYPYINDRYDELIGSCLSEKELLDYSTIKEENGIRFVKTIYAINISNLKIFDKLKELSEFRKPNTPSYEQTKPFAEMFGEPYSQEEYRKQCEMFGFVLTKAPQNMCYIEVEE